MLDVAGNARSNAWIGRANGSAPTADAAIYRAADNTLGFSTSNTERARIDSSGKLLLNTTSLVASVGGQINIAWDGSVYWGISMQTTYATGSGVGSYYLNFYNSSASNAGRIELTGATTVSYVTTSDYRLKENVIPIANALSKVAQLKPVTYKWKVDGSSGEGFIAHELAEVCPYAVTGKKDDVNKDGSIKPQGVDTSFLVATLTAAIQELTARVAQLESK